MITQQDCDKIVNALRSATTQVIGDSVSKAILAGALSALFLAQFKAILPDGVTIPEDAEKVASECESFRRMLAEI